MSHQKGRSVSLTHGVEAEVVYIGNHKVLEPLRKTNGWCSLDFVKGGHLSHSAKKINDPHMTYQYDEDLFNKSYKNIYIYDDDRSRKHRELYISRSWLFFFILTMMVHSNWGFIHPRCYRISSIKVLRDLDKPKKVLVASPFWVGSHSEPPQKNEIL